MKTLLADTYLNTPFVKGGLKGDLINKNRSGEISRDKKIVTKKFHLAYNLALKEPARLLRKNMTKAEKKLWWNYLRNFKYNVLRQKPIDNFIADFYCPKLKLVIEIDGSDHFTNGGKISDAERTAILGNYGLKIIRFTNDEILRDFAGVRRKIEKEIPPSVFVKNPPYPPLLKGDLRKNPADKITGDY